MDIGDNGDTGTQGREHRELSEHRKGLSPDSTGPWECSIGRGTQRRLRQSMLRTLKGMGVMSYGASKGYKPDCQQRPGFSQVRDGPEFWGDRGRGLGER